ncbi:MAG: BrnT family toxin [Candidatus Omnitrophica bacterium]|nr:BrnT family toxin [Candidatus Omnitrophota bacterium]
MVTRFEWDDDKDRLNQEKHGVGFRLARYAFADPKRVISEDPAHSSEEDRFYCIGRVRGGILTVRFTYRQNVIRIFGAGYWRKGKKLYEEQDSVQR